MLIVNDFSNSLYKSLRGQGLSDYQAGEAIRFYELADLVESQGDYWEASRLRYKAVKVAEEVPRYPEWMNPINKS